MRFLLTLLACLTMAVTIWGGTVQAAAPGCTDGVEQIAVHVAGDCAEVPPDADKSYPHCHTACHGHHIAAPVLYRSFGPASTAARDYAFAAEATLTADHFDRTLRPPQA